MDLRKLSALLDKFEKTHTRVRGYPIHYIEARVAGNEDRVLLVAGITKKNLEHSIMDDVHNLRAEVHFDDLEQALETNNIQWSLDDEA